MAWFGTNKNAGVKAYRPAFPEPDEVKYAVVDYSASHSSYVSETEQVFHYKGGAPPPSIQEYYNKHSPRKTGLLNGHDQIREEPHFGHWSPAHDNRAKKAEEFSPRAQVSHRPWSPTRDHGPKRDDEYFSPKAQPGHRPWNLAHDHGPKKENGFSPKARVQAGHGPNKGSPRGTPAYKGSSPPRDHYRNPGKYNDPNSDESDVESDYGHGSDEECEDGVCYRKGSRPNPNKNHLIGQNYDHDRHKERDKLGHSYSPPTSYANVPKKDPYYEKTYPKDNDYKPHKGNDNNIPPYKVPLATSPRKDTYYDHQSNNTHHPPPIKTRIDTHKAMELRKDSPRNSPRSGAVHQPQYGSPRKEYRGHPETIDSGEARRKYGTTLYRGGSYAEEEYKGTIDSLTAARIYKGVFVPN